MIKSTLIYLNTKLIFVLNVAIVVAVISYLFVYADLYNSYVITSHITDYPHALVSLFILIPVILMLASNPIIVYLNVAFNIFVGKILLQILSATQQINTLFLDEKAIGSWFVLKRIWTPEELMGIFLQKINTLNLTGVKISLTEEKLALVSNCKTIADLDSYIQLISSTSMVVDSSWNVLSVLQVVLVVAVVGTALLTLGLASVNAQSFKKFLETDFKGVDDTVKQHSSDIQALNTSVKALEDVSNQSVEDLNADGDTIEKIIVVLKLIGARVGIVVPL